MDNKEKVWNYLIDKGFSPEVTAGIMGNIEAESTFDPNAINSHSGAYGLFQWLGSRKDGLMSYAKDKGKNVNDIEVQLDYFWEELQGSEKATLEALSKEGKTPEEYAEIFEESFERSGGSNLENRKKYAGDIFQQYSVPVTTPQKTNSLGLKWWGDIVKVIFCVAIIVGAVAFLGIAITNTSKTGAKIVDKVIDEAKEVIKND